jgi:hypothetical protein
MKTPLLSLALLAAGTFVLRAEVTVTAAPNPPTEDVVLMLEVPDSGAIGYQWRHTPAAGRRDIGQIFTADSPFVLDRLTLQLQSGTGVGAKAAPFRLTVFEWDRAAKKITRTLGTFEGTMPAVVSPANTYLSFDLGDQKPALEAGATYGFLLSFEEPLDARALSLQSSNENAGQPSVRRVESADGQTLQVSPWVLEFYLQGTAK